MNILMIGGTALVGPHVIRELSVDPTNQIWTLTRSGRSYFCEHSLQGDRNDKAVLSAAIATAKPDVIVDMIPFTTGNAATLVAAYSETRSHARLVALSSIDVYSAFGRIHKTETAPLQPTPITEDMALRCELGPEGAAYDKIGAERVLLGGFEHATILRLPAIYGWPDTTRVQQYLEQMLAGASVISMSRDMASFRFSRCLHKNAAFAVALAVDAAGDADTTGQQIYNVAEQQACTELEWLHRIAACCGWAGRVDVTPWSADAETPRQQFDVATTSIRQDLGYFEKYNVTEGLSDTVAYYCYLRLGKTYHKDY